MIHDTVKHIVQGICKSAMTVSRRQGARAQGTTAASPADLQAYLALAWPELMDSTGPGGEMVRPTASLPHPADVAVGRAAREQERERFLAAAAAATVTLASAGATRGAATGGAKRALPKGDAAPADAAPERSAKSPRTAGSAPQSQA